MSNERSIEARNGGLSRAMEGRLLPILAFFTILFGVLLPTSASAMQCVRLVDPSGFIAKVSWYKAGDLTFSQNQTSGKYDVAIKPNIAPRFDFNPANDNVGLEVCPFAASRAMPILITAPIKYKIPAVSNMNLNP